MSSRSSGCRPERRRSPPRWFAAPSTRSERPIPLLDVNVLVALAWDSHVHHVPSRRWFVANSARGWATCPITESGFVRVSSNPRVIPSPISVHDARHVLAMLRGQAGHRFLVDDVSMTDADLPPLSGHRQVTDAHLLAIAHRHRVPVLTLDTALAALGAAAAMEVELLEAF